MTLREQLSTSDRPEERDRSRSVPPELAEADRLIADLAALVDAGLVVVHEHVLGPVRYGAAAPHDARRIVEARDRPGPRVHRAVPANTGLRSA
jgi:hypothetical protein